ncbi:exocyst complex component 3-like protein 4 [Megalops cyprinoides]|uniref:exocyst complex component 3-like protein 4 n=1 Tax=Megalops cyprinoides TaxID=118141 RepID=UPI001864976F|nr:exocyst complex component 3-like protein 4 [Megalops cyprinoides]
MAETGQGNAKADEAKSPEGKGVAPDLEKTENGEAQADGTGKREKKMGKMMSFRESMRLIKEKSPLTSNNRSSKEILNTERALERSNSASTPEKDTPAPASPRPSPGSPMLSPVKALMGVFKKEGDSAEGSPQTRKTHGHSRSQSDPTLAVSNVPSKSGIRRSLWLSKKEKVPKQEPLQPVSEVASEKSLETAGVEETYTIPEIPLTPLSVMQINKLIEMEVLEEAHLNLLSLREELRREQEAGGDAASTMDLVNKQKDLDLLYRALRDKVKDIVRDSSKLPSRNKELLVHVARIIQEEEKREGSSGSGQGGWMDTWKEAVLEGVRAKIGSVHLDSREQNTSWLAVHLGLLGTAIVEDLENVKNELKDSYPPSFDVFNTYVDCYHQAIAQHLKKILQLKLDSKDLYALLDWIINRYESEKIMGSVTLQPDMREDNKALSLEHGFLDRIKTTYFERLKEDVRTNLGNLVKLECDDMWKERKRPSIDEGFYHSEIPIDILTVIKPYVVNSKRIDPNLEKKVVCACSEELKGFPQRFEAAFRQQSETWTDHSLQAEYEITYINSFTALKEQMEVFRDSSPEQVEQLGKEMEAVVSRLGQCLLERYKAEIRPFLRRMMTRKWLSTDEDFKGIVNSTKRLSNLCGGMKPPYVQTFVNEVQYYVVKEYISQLMKNNYSCKNGKNVDAAAKMKNQWEELQGLFEELKSTSDWLEPIGEHLCNIIGQKNKKEIKNSLQPLLRDYPDFSKKHLAAVLSFRGMVRGRERQLILRRVRELKQSAGDSGDVSRALFSDMQVTVNTDCLARVPFFCLPPCLSDS